MTKPKRKPEAPEPSVSVKRRCIICTRPLSQYNKGDVCMSHRPEDVERYHEMLKQNELQDRASKLSPLPASTFRKR